MGTGGGERESRELGVDPGKLQWACRSSLESLPLRPFHCNLVGEILTRCSAVHLAGANTFRRTHFYQGNFYAMDTAWHIHMLSASTFLAYTTRPDTIACT